ncbi:MAG: hypothetical protein AB4372_13465 [Xenococcus sp. (in: cyanobacteria)]
MYTATNETQNQLLQGTDNDDTLIGGAGDDTIVGNRGNDLTSSPSFRKAIPTGVKPLRWVDSSTGVPTNSFQVQARLAQPL